MGHKTNPIGLRLQINRTWDSRWFAEGRSYARLLREDLTIRKFIVDSLPQAAISKVVIERPAKICRVSIYAARPDVGAVVHTHSPYATAWSFLDAPLAPATEDVSYYGIGTVVTAAYAPPGSAELARSACASLAGGRGVLLARHGVLAAAASVDEALSVAAAIEHQATVAWLLRADVADSPAPLSLRRFAAALAN